MSKQVDERIVSMQFDNKNFESNARTSMSTLDKLKEKLNFKAAAKGVDNLDAAVKKVDLSPIGRSADKVGLQFSAMYTIADQAFRNIYNSAANYAKKIVSAFTIDPIKTGFQEYETQINAVQTILANTESKGTTLDDVNAALDTLNKYADKTIYNFTEMTKNIGTFTAAGVDLDTSVKSIQGIANLAAVSGSNSQQAATAMYQLSQALSSGTVKLMDWNSVVNAGMGGQVFQDALKETARVHGVAIDSMIEEQGSFRETLSDGWLTADILNETLEKFTLTTEGLTEAEKKANREMLKAKGYTDDQIEGIFKLGNTATNAATKVKTFTQLFDTLKEAAQSGWTQTWEIIFGDFNEAKTLFTGISDFIGNIINKSAEARNFLVSNALKFAAPWEELKKKLDTSFIGKTVDKVADYTDKLKYFQDIMHSVWMGNYKNSDTGRYDLLDNAGYDHRVVQELVNISDKHYKDQGWKYQLTVDDIRAAHEKYGVALDENSVSLKKTDKATTDLATALEGLSDKQLKQKGFTDDEIKILRELQKESKRTGKSIEEISKEMSEFQGRDAIIESFKNAGQGLLSVFTALKDAWVEIFPPISFVQLYNAIKGIHEFSKNLVMGEETADNLKRTFKGLFAILDIATTLVGGGFKIAFKAAKALLGLFNIDILEFTAMIGDAAVALRDWIDSILDFEKIFKGIISFGKKAFKAIGGWFEGLKNADDVGEYIKNSVINGVKAARDWIKQALTGLGNFIVEKFESAFGIDLKQIVLNFASKVKSAFGSVMNWFKASDFVSIAWNCITGFISGLGECIPIALKAIWDFGKNILSTICGVLGIHSPSREFTEIGKNIILGLVNGVKEGLGIVWNLFTTIGKKLIEMIGDLDLGTFLAASLSIGGLVAIFTALKAVRDFASVFSGIGDIFNSVSAAIDRISWAVVMKQMSKAVINFAIAIGILVASLYVLTKLADDSGALWEAIGALATLAAIVAGLAIVMAVINKPAVGVKGKKGASSPLLASILSILAISGSILLLAMSLKKMSTISPKEMKTALTGMVGVIAGVIAVALAFTKLAKGKVAVDLAGAGAMMMKMAIAMWIMIQVVKMASKLDRSTVLSGLAVIASIELLFMAVIAVSKFAGANASAAGSMLFKMSIAMLIMVGVVALAGNMDQSVVEKGIDVIKKIGILFAAIVAVSIFAGTNASAAGSMLFKMALAILTMTAAIKLIALMDGSEIARGMVVIAAVEILFGALIAVSKFAGANASAAGSMLFKMSIALLVLSGVIFILSLIKPDGLARAVAAIAVLEACFAGIIAATRIAKAGKDMQKTLIMMAVIIALLVGAVVGLSFIKPENLLSASAAITMVTGIFAALLAITKYTKNTKQTIRTLMSMAGVVILLAGIVAGLSFINADNAIKACEALAILMGVFAAMMVATKFMKNTKDFTKSVIALTAMVVPLCAFVAALAYMPEFPDSVVENLQSLLLVMTVMTALLVPLAAMGKLGGDKTLLGVVALTAMALPLVAFIGVLALMQNVQVATENVRALIDLATAMTLLLIPLSLIGFLVSASGGTTLLGVVALTTMALPLLAFVGVLALMQNVQVATDNVRALIDLANAMTLLLIPLSLVGVLVAASGGTTLLGIVALAAMALPLLAFIGVLVLMQGIENATTNVMLLVTLMTVMSDVLIKISLVAPLAVIAVAAIIALGEVILAFGVIVTAIGALMTYFPQLQTFVDTGIQLMVQLASGLGQMIGAFITGFAGEVMTLLPMLGTCLSTFMMNAMPFITGAKLVDESVLAGVAILAGSVIALTAADLISGVAAFFSGGSSFASLGTELSNFMMNAMPFIMGASMLNESVAAGVKVLAETILILTAADILNGLTSWLTGGSSLADFANQLPILGKGLADFTASIGTFSEDQVSTVNCAAQAVKTLASAAQEIPNTGGLLASIVGNNDLGVFADQFPILGRGIRDFLTNIGAFTPEEQETVKCASEAVKTLASAAQEIPNAGGLVAGIVGNNDLGVFADQFPILGRGIRDFLTSIGTFTPEEQETVKCAAEVIKTLANVAKEIPNTGGLLAAIVGDNDLGTFASKLPDVGAGIKKFVNKLGTFKTDSIKTANTAVEVIKAIAKLAGVDLKKAKDQIDNFGDKMVTFADDVAAFVTGVTKVTTKNMNKAVAHVESVINLAKKLKSGDAEGIKDFGKNLKSLGEKSIDKFIKAFTGDATASKISSAAKTITSKFTKALDGKTSSFETAGADLANGLIKGINSKKQAVYDAAYALGKKAVQGEKDGQKSKSPSKLTIQAGEWFGEGLIIGIERMTNSVYKSGKALGETATASMSSAIARIRDAFDSDIDTQPTIQPVLDLTEVRSGASAINGLFSGRRTLAIDTSAVGVVAASMSKLQNGRDSSELLSAIKGLRKDVVNNPRNSYNINGINVTEGSDVADAIETLVRAVKVEGRT